MSIRATAIVIVACVAAGLTAAPADTRLVEAARRGDAAAVRSLIRQRAPAAGAEVDGSTALHWAARLDRVDLVEVLIRAGAPVNAVNRYGVTPLTLAAVNGSAAVVGRLLDAGANPNLVGPDGDTVLMIAARTGQPAAVRLLLARPVDVNARERWQGETAVMWAAAEDHADVVSLLAAKGADLNVRSTVPDLPKVKVDAATMVTTALPKGGMTALMLAARQGALAGTRALAEAGARLDETDPDGTTALNIAIINAHYEVAALLVEKGADPNVADAAGMTPLYAAIDMQYQDPLINRPLARPTGRLRPVDIVAVLLAHGANPNAPLKSPLLMRQHNGGDASLGEGATPLMRAAKVSSTSFISLLLDNGADPNRRLRNQSTALMIAAARGGRNAGPEQNTIDAARLLLAKGADINAANDSGDTALHIAIGRGDGLVRFLAENGARLDARDKSDRTPLDVAMGVPSAAGGGGRGRGGRGAAPAAAPVRETTAAILRELMNARQP